MLRLSASKPILTRDLFHLRRFHRQEKIVHPHSDGAPTEAGFSHTNFMSHRQRIMALPSSVTVLDHTFLDRSRRH